jgi:hypothetical protein
MEFQQKYLKYKEKYLELKKMKAGYLRYYPRGPMIGYPAIPYVSPEVKVTGPIPGPMPLPIRLPLPSPFIVGPRLIRVSESETKCQTCPKCTAVQTYKVYFKISLAELQKISPMINEEFSFILLDTCDLKYRDEILKLLNAKPISIGVIPWKVASPFIQLDFDMTNINRKLTNKIATTISNNFKLPQPAYNFLTPKPAPAYPGAFSVQVTFE